MNIWRRFRKGDAGAILSLGASAMAALLLIVGLAVALSFAYLTHACLGKTAEKAVLPDSLGNVRESRESMPGTLPGGQDVRETSGRR
jgi:hypothetical protein